jgi:hypothetical protein
LGEPVELASLITYLLPPTVVNVTGPDDVDYGGAVGAA